MRSKKFTVEGIEVTVSTGKDEKGNAAVILAVSLKDGAELKTELGLDLEQDLDPVFDRIDLVFVERWITKILSSPLAPLLKSREEEAHA